MQAPLPAHHTTMCKAPRPVCPPPRTHPTTPRTLAGIRNRVIASFVKGKGTYDRDFLQVQCIRGGRTAVPLYRGMSQHLV